MRTPLCNQNINKQILGITAYSVVGTKRITAYSVGIKINSLRSRSLNRFSILMFLETPCVGYTWDIYFKNVNILCLKEKLFFV